MATEEKQAECEVTFEEYRAYEDVRRSGVTNMFDVKMVEALSGLERERVIAVMKNFAAAREAYGARYTEEDEADPVEYDGAGPGGDDEEDEDDDA
jgi:hypothetical protein